MVDNNTSTPNDRRSSRSSKRVAAKAPVLPSARAAVGALLCVVAALLTFVAYRQAQQPPTTKYLVAAREMEPGAALELADVREEAITLPPEVAARSFTTFAQLEDLFLLGPIQQGELLQASNLVRRTGGDGTKEWSFSIEAINAAGGRIRVGERIQILGTAVVEGLSRTEVVNPNALVIGIDRTDPNQFRGSINLVLALTSDDEVLRMEAAKNTLKLTIVRGITSPGISDQQPPQANTAEPEPTIPPITQQQPAPVTNSEQPAQPAPVGQSAPIGPSEQSVPATTSNEAVAPS